MNGFEATQVLNRMCELVLPLVPDDEERRSAGRVLRGRIADLCGLAKTSESQQLAAVNFETVQRGKDETRHK